MEIFRSPQELQKRMRTLREQGKIISLVPTMGALHAGHTGLFRTARPACDVLTVSIFVNPIQFDNPSDLAGYPRSWDKDVAVCEAQGVDVIYAPTVEAMYPQGFQTKVHIGEMAARLCGASRPGHFDGMATVVLKLFNASLAHYAWFGEKDFQQFKIVEQMVRDLNLSIKPLSVPIIREESGLALSSRNLRLNEKEKKQALILSQTLTAVTEAAHAGEREVGKLLQLGKQALTGQAGLTLDYLEIVSAHTLQPVARLGGPARILIAAQVGPVRLIDNMDITVA
ncbi:MAG: pantoate--beta-alanine ligase [Desulfarculales bacterium]|nr:pantoate--beta-alanine ligase [Desulfarculales bacterium]